MLVNSSGAYGAASPAKSAGLKVHNVGFSVGGSDGPLRQALAAAVDRTRLQALVGRPLPNEAQSEAYAAMATPVVVPGLPGAVSTTAAPTVEPTSAKAATPASAQTTAAERPGTAAAPAATPKPAATPAAEPVKKAADAVNTLRGLFGR